MMVIVEECDLLETFNDYYINLIKWFFEEKSRRHKYIAWWRDTYSTIFYKQLKLWNYPPIFLNF